MAYKNFKALLIDSVKLPVAIEGKLPSGAPKLSTGLTTVYSGLPDLPDSPVALPDLPAVPALPNLPAAPAALRRRYITGAEILNPSLQETITKMDTSVARTPQLIPPRVVEKRGV